MGLVRCTDRTFLETHNRGKVEMTETARIEEKENGLTVRMIESASSMAIGRTSARALILDVHLFLRLFFIL